MEQVLTLTEKKLCSRRGWGGGPVSQWTEDITTTHVDLYTTHYYKVIFIYLIHEYVNVYYISFNENQTSNGEIVKHTRARQEIKNQNKNNQL